LAKKIVFVCDACGYETFKWMGKCPRCGGWDTIREYKVDKAVESQEKKSPVVVTDDDITEERTILGIDEMDRVLGGGLTIGSSILLGGDPGIGKTTLCFEIAARMVELGLNVLYVSGEESLKQLASRRKRLNLNGNFPILATNQLDDIVEAATGTTYHLVIVDSIQSVYNSSLPMLPGNVSQIKDVSSKIDDGDEIHGYNPHLHRPRDERGRYRRPKDPRAYGGYGALF